MNGSLVRKENFNTNNSWGFGGSYGTHEYYSNGVVITKGEACFRHAPSESYEKAGFMLEGSEEKMPVYKRESGMQFLRALVRLVMNSDKLFVYENETGYRVALVDRTDDWFSCGCHEYRFLKEVLI